MTSDPSKENRFLIAVSILPRKKEINESINITITIPRRMSFNKGRLCLGCVYINLWNI